MGRARRQPVVPGDEIPDDRAHQAAEDYRGGDDVEVDHPGPHRFRHGGPESERREEIERRRPHHRLARRQDTGGDNGGDGVGGVVEAVDEIEDERNRNKDENRQQDRIHRLPVLDDDAFEQIADVLAAVRGCLEEVEDLLPLDHRDRVALLVEERHDRVLVHAIRFPLELIHPRRNFKDSATTLIQGGQRFGNPVHRLADDVRQPPGAGSDSVDLVETRHRRCRVDGVHHVVERYRERMNVLAVERGHEGAVHAVDDAARPAVAQVLDVLDRISLAHVGRVARHHLLEQLRAAAYLFGKADEVVEEVFGFGYQAEGHAYLLEGVSGAAHLSETAASYQIALQQCYISVTSCNRVAGLSLPSPNNG